MKIVTLITARGGSKGIPNKNIKNINGKPLISYSIEASLKSNVSDTWVSTEDSRIKQVSLEYGAQVIDRPVELANDYTMPDEAILHFAKNINFDYVVFIHPTSPMIKPEYINKGIEKVTEEGYDSSFAVVREHWTPTWTATEDLKPIDWDIANRPRRQDKSDVYREIGMFYVTKKELLLKSGLRYSGRIATVEIPLIHSFQLDSLEDLQLIEKIL